MNKAELEKLANLRINEAQALLTAKHYHGAYYLAGYALECALKVCIAKKVNQYDFPNKQLANESYSHDLTKLISVAELKIELIKEEKSNQSFALNWSVAKTWSEEARYKINITQAEANDLIDAITDNNSGVLTWLKKFW